MFRGEEVHTKLRYAFAFQELICADDLELLTRCLVLSELLTKFNMKAASDFFRVVKFCLFFEAGMFLECHLQNRLCTDSRKSK